MSDELGTDIGEGEVIRETAKAILVRLETGDEKWIPKGVIHDDSEVYDANEGSSGIVIVKDWFAKKEGLA